MNPLTFYKYGTYGLLVMNVMMLAFFFFFRPKSSRPHTRQFEQEAMKMLSLDETQRFAFKDAAKKHGSQVRGLNEDNRRLVEQFFLDDGSTDSLLISKIQQLESQKLILTKKHFEEIKNILKPDQIKHFEPFKRRALGIILKQGRGGPPR